MAAHPTDNHLHGLRAFLSPSEIIDSSSAEYEEKTLPWGLQADLHPSIVVVPSSIESLGAVVKYLYSSDLDFVIRSTSTGSASAKDVLVSLDAFHDFNFANEIVTCGASLDWGEVDRMLEEKAPGFAVVGARCPYVGVAGSIIVGGLSWLSHEFGMISDPQNFLDAQVVLYDGRVLWASEEPDLLWALRGGGANFGVLTQVKLRARRYTDKIFAGTVILPSSMVQTIAKGVSTFDKKREEPKMAAHIFSLAPVLSEEFSQEGEQPGIGLFLYDANGEAHGRSEEGFAWCLGLEGAKEDVRETTIREVNWMTNVARPTRGKYVSYMSAPLLSDIDDETLVRAWQWYADSIKMCKRFGENSFVLLEFMQQKAMGSTKDLKATAWPHGPRRHVLQMGISWSGTPPLPDNTHELAKNRLSKAASEIAGEEKMIHQNLPGFPNEWDNPEVNYGGNWEKLKEVKKRYDPKNRFNKAVHIPIE